MKTLRLIGATAVAVLMGCAFSACDDDVTDQDPFQIVNTEWDVTDCCDDIYYDYDPVSIRFYDNETGRLYLHNGGSVSFSYEERDVGMLEIYIDGVYWEGDWTNHNGGNTATYTFARGGDGGGHVIKFVFVDYL